MSDSPQTIIVDKNGMRATVTSDAVDAGDADSQIIVQTSSGHQVLVPAQALIERMDGSYFLPFSLNEMVEANPADDVISDATDNKPSPTHAAEITAETAAATAHPESTLHVSRDSVDTIDDNVTVMPVIVEEVNVERRTIETGRVRITKTIQEEEKTVDEPIIGEQVTVERVPINRVVEAAVPVRHVGDTMIVPVLEEVVVVEKRLVLKEELHITKRRTETRTSQQVVLRSEQAVIERIEAQEQQQSAANGDGLEQVRQEG